MRDITDAEFSYVCLLVQDLCGLSLDSQKKYLVQTRLTPILLEVGADSYVDLLKKAKLDIQTRAKVIDAITTHETSFFRHPPMFNLIRKEVFSDYLKRNERGNGTFNVWSVACSTGQEAYSVMMAARGSEIFQNVDCMVLGTDISVSAVQRAKLGIFSHAEIARGLTEEQRQKFFVPREGEWEVISEIRKACRFRQQNLLEPFSEQMYDLVLCCNLAIYFSKEDRVKLFSKLIRHIRPGGFLLLGASEVLDDGVEGLEAFEQDGVRYFRPIHTT